MARFVGDMRRRYARRSGGASRGRDRRPAPDGANGKRRGGCPVDGPQDRKTATQKGRRPGQSLPRGSRCGQSRRVAVTRGLRFLLLQCPHRRERTALLEQDTMGAALDDPALVEDDDLVGIDDRGQAVRNHERRALGGDNWR